MSTTVVGDIIYNLDVNTARFMNGMNDAQSRLGQLNGGLNRTDTVANRTTGSMNKLGIAIAGVVSVAGIKTMAEAAEKFTVLQARVDRLSDSATQGAATFGKLLEIANNTGVDMGTTVKVWESMTGSLKEMGKSNADIISLTDTLQKMGSIGGSSSDEMKAGLRQLGQSFAGGIIRAEEFNSVLENTPEIARQMAKGMGIPFGELRQQMLDGKLTAEVAFNAIQKRSEYVNAEFAKMPRTISDASTAISNSLGKALSDLDKQSGFSSTIVKSLDMASASLKTFYTSVDGVSNAVEYGRLAIESIAAVIAGRYVTAMYTAASASLAAMAAARTATAAAIESAQTDVAKATSAKIAAMAQLELSNIIITAAKAELAANQQAQAAEIKRLQAVQQALISERALAAENMKTASTQNARTIATARMIEVQTALTAINGQLSAAEGVLAATNTASSAKIAAGYEARAVSAGTAAAATETLNAATVRAAGIATTTSVAMRGLGTAMSFLGGPLGVIMLAGVALYYFADAARSTKVDVDALNGSLDRLTFNQLAKASNDAGDDIVKLNKQLSASFSELRTMSKRPWEDETDFKKRQTAAQAERDSIQAEINKRQDLIKKIVEQQAVIKKEQEDANKPQAQKAKEHKIDPEDKKVLDNLKDQRELAKLTGEEKARLTALQKLSANATDAEKLAVSNLAAEIYNLDNNRKEGAKAEKEAARLKAKADKEEIKDEKEKAKNAEENKKAIIEYAIELAKLVNTTEDYSEASALAKLNKFATPEDVRVMKELAAARKLVVQADENKKLLGATDSMAGEDQRFAQEMKDLKTLNDAKLLENDRYLSLVAAAEQEHSKNKIAIAEQEYRNMSLGNEMVMASIDAMGQASTNILSGILSGTMTAKEAMASLANTVLNAVIGSFVQAGVEFVKAEIVKRVAVKATEAAQVAGIGTVAAVQTGATTAIAATTTTAAATTGTAVAGSMAPAAGLASIASFGSAAVIGGAALVGAMLLAKSFGGGRQYGGSVNSDSVYRINETGPEIFTDNTGKQFMTGANGHITSNKDAFGGAGSSRPVQVIIEAHGVPEPTVTQQSLTDRDVIRIVVGNIAEGGSIGQAVNNVTGTRRQGA